MAKPVFIPKFGFTLEESELVEWLVEEGATVQAGDPVAEVTTDKVNMEVEAPMDGILAGVCAQVGDMVAVTATIAWILAPGEELPPEALSGSNQASQPASGEPEKEEAAQSAAQPTVLPTEKPVTSPSTSDGNSKVVQSSPVATRMAEAHNVDLNQVTGSGRDGRIERRDIEAMLPRSASGKVRATPAARRLAREAALDLASVNGSGPYGRVQAIDVEEAAAKVVQAAVAASSQTTMTADSSTALDSGGTTRVPFTNMRRAIARRLQQSAQEAPHIFFEAKVDVSEMQVLCKRANEQNREEQVKVSLTAGITRAVAWALGRHPLVNSHLVKNEQGDDEAILYDDIHIGMAVALDNGLVVPVIRHANRKGMGELSAEIRGMAEKARGGKLSLAEMSGGTFSISNLGMYGIDRFTAIINPPEVGILAVGSIQKALVVDEDDQPMVRPMMSMTLSVDHRVIDGAVAAQFLADLKRAVENPAMMVV